MHCYKLQHLALDLSGGYQDSSDLETLLDD
jgi:hypothetical protein